MERSSCLGAMKHHTTILGVVLLVMLCSRLRPTPPSAIEAAAVRGGSAPDDAYLGSTAVRATPMTMAERLRRASSSQLTSPSSRASPSGGSESRRERVRWSDGAEPVRVAPE